MQDRAAERVLHQADDARVVGLTQRLIRIPSPSLRHRDGGENEISEFLAQYLREIGLEVVMQTVEYGGRQSKQAVAIWKGSGAGPSLMFCGHVDCNTDANNKPLYRPDLWTRDWLSGEIEDGWVYGLGAVNMKSGVAAMVDAVNMLREAGVRPSGDIILAPVMGEISGGLGILRLIESGYRPDYCVVTECTDLDLVTVSVGDIRGVVTLHGRQLHHDPFVNPIEKAARVIQAFGPTYGPMDPNGWLKHTPHPLMPNYPRMAVKGIESTTDSCTLWFDLRTVPGMTEENVTAAIRALLGEMERTDPDFKWEFRTPLSAWTCNMPAAPETPPDSPVVRAVAAQHERVRGRSPVVGAGRRLGGAADSSHLKLVGVTTIEYGPGTIDIWPMVDERTRTQDIADCAKVLALTALELVG